MDEPFGALDPILRARAQEDLRALQRRLGTTIVLVTHDMEEALTLGDRIAVMAEGRLQQYARPAELLTAPANDFVRALLGSGDPALRLLGVQDLAALVEPGPAEGPAMAVGASMRAALAECLWSRRSALPVSRDGVVIGRVTRAALEAAGGRPSDAGGVA
jgi:osmoprotectant transport system ATP-binding protein